MVRFEKERLVIEIDSKCPVEHWMLIHQGLCDLMRQIKQENINEDTFYWIADFLGDFMPDWEIANKMKA